MLVYAIDFGTSNSLLAAAEPGKVHAPIPLDPDARDPSILRSILYFPTMKEVFFGTRAITEFTRRDMEGRLLRSVKKFLPMRSFIGTWVEDRPLNLEDIVGIFLLELRKRANAHFGQDVESVVLGRPARFSLDDADDGYAQYRLERAAKFAGFKHIEFLAEPVAAAREYRLMLGGGTQDAGTEKTVLVADFGGGTSDFTVIRIGKGEFRPSDVLAIGGVPVAGDALDGAVMRRKIAPHFGSEVSYKVPFGSNVLTMPVHLMERICAPADISVLRKRDTLEFFRNVRQWSLGREDRRKMDRLFALINEQLGFAVFEEIERTKRALSEADRARFGFHYPDVEIEEDVSRGEFEVFSEEQVARIVASLDSTVQAAQLKYSEIDLICCTGGTAKVPVIRRELASRFGEEKVRQHNHFHSIVQGLAERARELSAGP